MALSNQPERKSSPSVWSHQTVRLCACDNSHQPASPTFETETAISDFLNSKQVFVVLVVFLSWQNMKWRYFIHIGTVFEESGSYDFHRWRVNISSNYPGQSLTNQDCLSLDQLTQLVIGSSWKSMTISTTFNKAVKSSGSFYVRLSKDKWQDGVFANDSCMPHERGCLADVVTLSWTVSSGARSNSYPFVGNWTS